jgi:hypothetical protein
MNANILIFPVLLFLTACNKSSPSASGKKEPDLASDTTNANESQAQPQRPDLPPDISTNVEKVSDYAECRLTHQTWGDMKRSIVKQAELEYKSVDEIESDLYDLPFGGYFSLRIPRSTFSELKPEFFSVVVLDTTGAVVERPELGEMDVSPNGYGGAYADANFKLSKYVNLPFEVHVVDRVSKKKSIFRVSNKN